MAIALKQLGKFYNKFEEYLLVTSLIVTTLLIFAQVIMRFVFNSAFSWSEELGRYIFIWQIWLGASIAVREGVHIRVEILFGLLKGKAAIVAEIVADLIWFAFCVFLVLNSFELMEYLIKTHSVSPAMQMPLSFAYASIPVGVGAMGIRLIGVIFGKCKKLFSKGEPGDGQKGEVQQ